MAIGDHPLGVVGVRNVPELSPAERRAIGAAVELVSSALRNVQLLAQMHENSVRDPLTTCFNRAYALEALATELQRAKRSGQPVSIMMFDLDRFKRMNDDYGHLVGDAVLAAVGGQMATTLRAGDVKCRWGGDEFLVVLPDTPLSGAEHAGGSLTREVGQLTIPTPGGPVSPTISVGVAVAEAGESDPMVLIARADEALYRAKHSGRNRFVVARSLRVAG
jgi:diguanylate cyclase (GGDEF)-like protein